MSTPAAPNWRRPPTPTAGASSLGLTTRQGALLAYSAGWVSGLALLTLESRDRDVRWHAAQSLLGFGALTILGAVFLAVAGLSLFTSLTMFRIFLWASQLLIVAGLLLWAWSLVQVARGRSPRWPLIAARVDRFTGHA